MNSSVSNFASRKTKLPEIGVTRSGIEFDPNERIWSFRDGVCQVSMNFGLLPEISCELLDGLKRTLLWYLLKKAPNSACHYFHRFVWFIRCLTDCRQAAALRVNEDDVLFVKMLSEEAEYSLSGLRSFFTRWVKLGGGGVSPSLPEFFESLNLKQSPVGVAVATLDPRKGPLSYLEFEALVAALNNSYAESKINLDELLQCYLFMSLGIRPVQLASMKCCDLVTPTSPEGDYVLMVPRAKQRERMLREEFKPRMVTQQLGQLLAVHAKKVVAEFRGILPNALEAPLFPQRASAEYAIAPGFEFHITAASVSNKVSRLLTSLFVQSERTGEAMSITPQRLRRTFATRASEEGWPLLVIAELMDHATTKHVEVYAGLTSKIRSNFSRKIALEMAPLAAAFSGRLIRDETEATRPVLASRIIDLRIDRSGKAMGNCGSYSHCGFARPAACYAGCYEFEPWLDGPHEAAFDYMLARRDYLMKAADPSIAAINDRAILGCAQVILRCREISSGSSDA